MEKQKDPIYQTLHTRRVEMPTRLRLPQSRTDQIRQYIREEMSRAAAHQGHESFEEADDLEPDDEENLPYTPYELRELEPPPPLQNGVKAEGQPPVDPAAKPEEPAPPSSPEVANGQK